MPHLCATLSFADSSATEWTAGATVVVSGFAERAIRFGTTKRGLAVSQRKRLVTSAGDRLYVNNDGYLTANVPGSSLIFR